jgi:spermidine synthase
MRLTEDLCLVRDLREQKGGIVGAVYTLFVISGFTGLAYEVIWTRLLVRVFGASSFAVTTVLASYMGGLALGSFAFGRLIDRKGHPLRVYGLLELGIGLFAVAFLYIVPSMSRLYGGLYPALQGRFYALSAVRFFLCFGILLIPTTLMGGTLPVLSKYLATGLAGLTERVGRLYAANTLGAVGGASAAGLIILPRLGIRNTTLLSALLDFGIVAVALVLSRERRGGAPAPAGLGSAADEIYVPKRISRHVLATFTITGFCALAAEVVWTRMLSLALGTTVYAFAIMLATFLLGLGAGSAVFARLAQRTRRPGTILGLAVAGVGLGVFLSLAIFGKIPFLYMEIFQRLRPGWEGLLWMQLLLCGITVLVPAFLMGGLFPLVARLYARDISRVGSEIGRVYAFNTIGSIIGSVAGTFLFLRVLGTETSLLVLGSAYVAAGVAVLLNIAEFRRRASRLCGALGVAAFAVLVLLASPGIDKKILTSGVYIYAPVYRTVEGLKDHMRRASILFYDEGVDATVSIEGFRGELSLLIDGKADASTGNQDMRTQVLVAQLPLLLHPTPQKVLVIGLGSGVSLGSSETHDVKRIDCVELLDNVVEASAYLRRYNFDCLADPRANLIVGDGRNHVLLTHEKYDVIISQPTNPWISGVGDLFTQEFFRLTKERLRPGGIMCAWFQTYNMGDRDVRALVKTFGSVYPHVSLWLSNDGNIILLGSLGPITMDSDLADRMSSPAVAADLKRIWTTTPLDLMANYVAGSDALARFSESAGELNTDDNMLLEFSAGLRRSEPTGAVQISNFVDLIELPPVGEGMIGDIETVRTRAEARKLALKGAVALSKGGISAAMPLFDEAYSLSPGDAYVLQKYVEGRMILGQRYYGEGDYQKAVESYLMALTEPDHPLAWQARLGLGMALAALGDYDGARESFETSIGQNPDNPRAYRGLGTLNRVTGNMQQAMAAFERSFELEPDAGAASDLSRVYMEMGVRLKTAAELAKEAVSWEPNASHYITLGWAHNRLGDDRGADRAMLKAIEMEPDNTEARFALATMRLARDDTEGAEAMLRDIVRLGKNDRYTSLATQKLRELEGR